MLGHLLDSALALQLVSVVTVVILVYHCRVHQLKNFGLEPGADREVHHIMTCRWKSQSLSLAGPLHGLPQQVLESCQ